MLVVAATLLLALVQGVGHHGQVVALRHGMPTVAMAVLVAAVVAVLPQPRSRLVLRDPDAVPVEEVRGVSPLAEVKAALVAAPPRTQLLLSAAPADGLIRRATLERYDGLSWTVEGRFHRTGDELPTPDRFDDGGAAGASSASRTETTITIAEALDRWVPAPGRPRSMEGTDFRWNARSGDLLADRPLAAGTTLRVTAAAVPVAEDIGSLTPATGADVLALTRTDGASDRLLAQLDGLLGAGGAGTPGERLAVATAALRRSAYSTSSPAGHQDGMLNYILETSKLGTPEQYAAIGALAARRAGFPARVVVGWKLTAAEGDAGAATHGEPIAVRTADAYAWVEIATTDGWRTIDVTPPRSQTEPEAPQDSAGAGSSAAATPEPPDEQGDATILSPGTDTGNGATLLQTAAKAGIRFGLPALVLAVLASIALLKLQRRRLRAGAAHPADRVLGAWDELVDRLIETGRPPDPAATPGELARILAEQVPDAGPAVGELAPLVDRAIHAPDLVADGAARDAWAHCRTASSALVRQHRDLRHPYRPITRPFDPRPLVRNRVHRS
ncbi:MAG: transglutaminase domain-containing protein [Acidimicrobiales bacterium]